MYSAVPFYLETLPTTLLMLCRSLHAEALQATASEGLALSPCVASGVGFEPGTFRTQGTEPTTEPQRHTPYLLCLLKANMKIEDLWLNLLALVDSTDG